MSAQGYLPTSDRPFRFSMGLRPLSASGWLEFDVDTPTALATKRELLATRRDDVVALNEEGDEACEELFALVRQDLATYHPGETRESRSDDHPLVLASELVTEDLCVLVNEDDEWILRAACVCFPSRWRLADKIGCTLDEIHGPVPTYDETLARPTRATFDRLVASKAYWRLNWTLLDSPQLFQPVAVRHSPPGGLEEWWVRVERQTIRRLAISGAIVFTIRTYVESVAAAQRREPALSGILRRALATAPPDVVAYKGWRGLAERLNETPLPK